MTDELDPMTAELINSAALNQKLQAALMDKRLQEELRKLHGVSTFGDDPKHIGAKDMQHAARIFRHGTGQIGIEVSESEDIKSTVLLKSKQARTLYKFLGELLDEDLFTIEDKDIEL